MNERKVIIHINTHYCYYINCLIIKILFYIKNKTTIIDVDKCPRGRYSFQHKAL